MTERKLVRDLMKVGVRSVAPTTPLKELAFLMLKHGLEGVIILGHEGHAEGIVTRDELVAGYGLPNWDALTAEDVMRDDVPQLPPDIPLAAAAQLMRDQHLRIVFLMHNAAGIVYPAASLTYDHLLRHLAAESEDDLRDLGIRAARRAPLDQFIQRRDAARNQPDEE